MSIRRKLLIVLFTTSGSLLCLLSGILLVETNSHFGSLVCVAMKQQMSADLVRDVHRHFDAALMRSLFWTVLAFMGVTIGVSAVLSRLFSKRILLLQHHAREIAAGNWTTDIPLTGKDELGQLEGTLRDLAVQLRRQEQLRKSLMQDIAHELRTPLATLKSHMEAFIDGVWEPTEVRLHSCVEEIDRFQYLVNQVEELYAAESRASRPESALNLNQIVDAATQVFASRCEQEGKTLKVQTDDAPTFLVANRHDIREIVWNLVDNAVKYTPTHGTISVQTQQSSDSVKLVVTDTGIGIPEADLSRVFERFYRTDKSRNRHTGGSGLGLAIVKRLVELSGGSIDVQSELGSGSCFTVLWPTQTGAFTLTSHVTLERQAESRSRLRPLPSGHS